MPVRHHFPWLRGEVARSLFAVEPGGVLVTARTLGVGLGATLYIPANRPNLVEALEGAAGFGAVAAVVCLEDSIAAADLAAAESNLAAAFADLPESVGGKLPMLFVRPRTPEHLAEFASRLAPTADRIVGACLPKFAAASAPAWFDALASVSEMLGRPFKAMPILEGPEILHLETRASELVALQAVLAGHRDLVVAVRIGTTDLCGLLGLRRGIDETIYDLGPVRNCIADIINVLGRFSDGFVLSGSVWEYFEREPRLWKPQLREALFADGGEKGGLRSELIRQRLDGLIKEAVADRANGLIGKTVIHPSHVLPVNALMVPTYEEWVDAVDVAAAGDAGGVSASEFGNKMNEPRPQAGWARRVLERAEIFGVLAEGRSFIDLLDA